MPAIFGLLDAAAVDCHRREEGDCEQATAEARRADEAEDVLETRAQHRATLRQGSDMMAMCKDRRG